MNRNFTFNPHVNLQGLHAFLGASQYHWINYDLTKLKITYKKKMATLRGTELHELASKMIKMRVMAQPGTDDSFNNFVNDSINFGMNSEQVLCYSENCFGTADAICYRNGELRIHDLKTGEVPAHIEQLLIYAALFCLEYRIKPGEIKFIELRIYQSNDMEVLHPNADEILPIMDKIIRFDKEIQKMKEEEKFYGK